MSDNHCRDQCYSRPPPTPVKTKFIFLMIFLPIFFSIIIFVVLIVGVLGGVLGTAGSSNRMSFNTQPSPTEVPVFFSPGDTRIMALSFNSFFCSELTLEINSMRTGASVYLITDTPPLTDRNNFTIRSNLVIHTYRYWNYYLYPGSNFTTSIRVPLPVRRGTFYLIKGHSNFQQFVNNPRSQSNEVLDSFSIPCTRDYTRQFSFQVNDEDEYYFVYQRSGPTCNRIGTFFRLQASISVSRFQYSTAGLTNAPRCSAVSGGQCSLHIPANLANYSALIVTDLPTNNIWEDNIDTSFHCSSTRGWAYAVIVTVPLLLVVGVTITTVILLVVYCWWKKRDSLRATWCNQHNTQTTTEAAPTSGVQLQRIEHNTQPTAEVDLETSAAAPITEVQQPMTDDYKLKQEEEKQHHLTAAPPPSYKDSLDYPTHKRDLPPPY